MAPPTPDDSTDSDTVVSKHDSVNSYNNNIDPIFIIGNGNSESDSNTVHYEKDDIIMTKTPLCCFFISRNPHFCRDGEKCKFRHNIYISEIENIKSSKIICSFGAVCRNIRHARTAIDNQINHNDSNIECNTITNQIQTLESKLLSMDTSKSITDHKTKTQKRERFWQMWRNNKLDLENYDSNLNTVTTETQMKGVDIDDTFTISQAQNYVGSSPAVRDSRLLRSQLEPLSTGILRKRLVQIFGYKFSEINKFSRGQLMQNLLQSYSDWKKDLIDVKKSHNESDFYCGRLLKRYSGISINDVTDSQMIITQLLQELRKWSNQNLAVTCINEPESQSKLQSELSTMQQYQQQNRQERPSIKAETYMILRTPMEFGSKNSRNAVQAEMKMKKFEKIWNLSYTLLKRTLEEKVDRCQQTETSEHINTFKESFFADQVTALAVTHNFQGSPHLDKQNISPFYAISIGDFRRPKNQMNSSDLDLGGNICVELDNPLYVGAVDTRLQFSKVDGRTHVHWVDPNYEGDRYSLIYYRTEGIKSQTIAGAANVTNSNDNDCDHFLVSYQDDKTVGNINSTVTGVTLRENAVCTPNSIDNCSRET